jgi:hypothetical protein
VAAGICLDTRRGVCRDCSEPDIVVTAVAEQCRDCSEPDNVLWWQLAFVWTPGGVYVETAASRTLWLVGHSADRDVSISLYCDRWWCCPGPGAASLLVLPTVTDR